MAVVTVVKNKIEGLKETYQVEAGKSILDYVNEYVNDSDAEFSELIQVYDTETGEITYATLEDDKESVNLSLIVNGKDVGTDYIVKADDSVIIGVIPMSSDWGQTEFLTILSSVSMGMAIGASIGVIFGGVGAIVGLAIGLVVGVVAGLIIAANLPKGSSTTSTYEGQLESSTFPDVRGASNQKLVGNQIPFLFGKRMITPFIVGTPYNKLKGDIGQDVIIRTLYMVGYAPLKLTDFKLGDLYLAHNRITSHKNLSGTTITSVRDTVLHGCLSGYKDTEADDGDILSRWQNNDVKLEILQKGDDYGTIYNKTVVQKEANATLIHINSKYLGDIAYKGVNFASGYRTNSIRISETCPSAIEVEVEFSEGLFRCRQETTKSNTKIAYSSMPCWVVIQWRFPDGTASSGEKANIATSDTSNGWHEFNLGCINENNKVVFGTYNTSARNSDVAFSAVNSDGSHDVLENVNEDWIGVKAYNFQNAGGATTVNNIPQTTNLRFNFRHEFTPAQCAKMVEKDYNKKSNSPISDFIEIRVIRLTPAYIDEQRTIKSGENGNYTYKDLLKWTYYRSETFNKNKYLNYLRNNTNLPSSMEDYIQRPVSEEDLQKCTLVALEVKADKNGEIQGELNKFNCIAESFLPYYDNENKKWVPEVSKVTKYYNENSEEISEEQYISDKKEGKNSTKVKSGNNWLSLMKSTIFNKDSYIPAESKKTRLTTTKITKESSPYYFCFTEENANYLFAMLYGGKGSDGQFVFFSDYADSYNKQGSSWYVAKGGQGGAGDIQGFDLTLGHTYKIEFINNGAKGEDSNDASGGLGGDNVVLTDVTENKVLATVFGGGGGGAGSKGKDGGLHRGGRPDTNEARRPKNQGYAVKDKYGRYVGYNGGDGWYYSNWNKPAECRLSVRFVTKPKSSRYILDSNLGKYFSSNVASVALLSMISPMLGKDANGFEDINFESLNHFYEFCQLVHDGRKEDDSNPKSPTIDIPYNANGYVYQPEKLEALLQKILISGRAVFTKDSIGRLQIIVDEVKDYPMLLINQQNCISSKYSRSYEDDYAGLQFYFDDEEDEYASNSLAVMADGEDFENPKHDMYDGTFKFITNRDQLRSIARYTLSAMNLQKESVEMTIGAEGYALTLGDKVAVQTDTLLIGTDKGGRIRQLIEDEKYIYGFITDCTYEYTGKVDNNGNSVQGVSIVQPSQYQESRVVTLALCSPDGLSMSDGTVLSPTIGTTNTVIFAKKIIKSEWTLEDSGDYNSVIYKPEIDNIVAFGEIGNITKEYTITQIKPNQKHQFELTMIEYNPQVYLSGEKLAVLRSAMTKPTYTSQDAITFDTNISINDILEKNSENTNPLLSKIQEVEEKIEGGDTTTPPTVPSALNVIALRDGLHLSIIQEGDKATDNLKSVRYEYSKNGTNWALISKDTLTAMLSFANNYYEIEDFANWQFRAIVTNIYGVVSQDSEGNNQYVYADTIDVSGYGTYKPSSPSEFTVKALADGSGLELSWKENIPSNFYGNVKYNISYSFDGKTRNIPDVYGNKATILFDRNIEGYPEKEQITKNLSIIEITSINSISEKKTKTSLTSSVDVSKYLTWKPLETTITAKANKNSNFILWNVTNKHFGSFIYNLYRIKDGEETLLLKNSSEFSFTDNFDNAYLEKVDLKNISYKVKITNIANFEKEIKTSVDTQNYGTWTPNNVFDVKGNVSADGSGVEISWSYNSSENYYGKTRFLLTYNWNGIERKINPQYGDRYFILFDRNIEGYPEPSMTSTNFKLLNISVQAQCIESLRVSSKISALLDYSDYGSWIPNNVTNVTAKALKDGSGIILNWSFQNSNYYGNTQFHIYYEWGEIKREIPIQRNNSCTILFDRNIEGYPEVDDLEKLRIFVQAQNIESNYYSEKVEASNNFDDYGTWSVEAPIISPRVTGRNVTLNFTQPERADKKNVYGTYKYLVRVRKVSLGQPDIFYKPNLAANPYLDEENYKIDNNTDTLEVLNFYQQVMPLTGQNEENPSPIDTEYEFEVIAKNITTGIVSYGSTIKVIALATGAKDVASASITTNKLADGCVTFDKIDAKVLSAENIATYGMIAEKAIVGKLNGDTEGKTNYWDLSTGDFRVGNETNYLRYYASSNVFALNIRDFNLDANGVTELQMPIYIVPKDSSKNDIPVVFTDDSIQLRGERGSEIYIRDKGGTQDTIQIRSSNSLLLEASKLVTINVNKKEVMRLTDSLGSSVNFSSFSSNHIYDTDSYLKLVGKVIVRNALTFDNSGSVGYINGTIYLGKTILSENTKIENLSDGLTVNQEGITIHNSNKDRVASILNGKGTFQALSVGELLDITPECVIFSNQVCFKKSSYAFFEGTVDFSSATKVILPSDKVEISKIIANEEKVGSLTSADDLPQQNSLTFNHVTLDNEDRNIISFGNKSKVRFDSQLSISMADATVQVRSRNGNDGLWSKWKTLATKDSINNIKNKIEEEAENRESAINRIENKIASLDNLNPTITRVDKSSNTLSDYTAFGCLTNDSESTWTNKPTKWLKYSLSQLWTWIVSKFSDNLSEKNLKTTRAYTPTSFTSIDSLFTYCASNTSWVGSANIAGTWYIVVSIRHRNGLQDGNNFGSLTLTPMFASNNSGARFYIQQSGSWSEQFLTTNREQIKEMLIIPTSAPSNPTDGMIWIG